MLLDIYIEDEKDPYAVVDPLLLTLIPYGRYSDVMRFFFTILDLYQCTCGHTDAHAIDNQSFYASTIKHSFLLKNTDYSFIL